MFPRCTEGSCSEKGWNIFKNIEVLGTFFSKCQCGFIKYSDLSVIRTIFERLKDLMLEALISAYGCNMSALGSKRNYLAQQGSKKKPELQPHIRSYQPHIRSLLAGNMMKLNFHLNFASTVLYDFDSKYNVTQKIFSSSVKVILIQICNCYIFIQLYLKNEEKSFKISKVIKLNMGPIYCDTHCRAVVARLIFDIFLYPYISIFANVKTFGRFFSKYQCGFIKYSDVSVIRTVF